uniref:Putative secreted protein n=1 Tax=Anopheles darlingi TaxID=43151 RepID=A0A2M4DQ60_ANODA
MKQFLYTLRKTVRQLLFSRQLFTLLLIIIHGSVASVSSARGEGVLLLFRLCRSSLSHLTRSFNLQQLVLRPPVSEFLFEKHYPIVMTDHGGGIVRTTVSIVMCRLRTVRTGREMVIVVFHIRRHAQPILASDRTGSFRCFRF